VKISKNVHIFIEVKIEKIFPWKIIERATTCKYKENGITKLKMSRKKKK
jgi:hypothetical protein